MISFGRRVVSTVCAVTLAASMAPAIAYAETPTGRGIPDVAPITVEADSRTTAEALGDLASPFSLTSVGPVPLKESREIRWIDRLNLTGFESIRTFYDALAEGSDNDGDRDFLIDDVYMNGAAQSSSGSLGVGSYSKEHQCIVAYVGSYTNQETFDDNFARAMPYAYAAIAAFDRDFPQVFWLSGSHGFTGWGVGGTLYVGYQISSATRSPSFPSESSIKGGIQALESNIDKIFNAVNKSAAKSAMVKDFNTWLTRNNAYNTHPDLEAAQKVYPNAWECVSALAGNAGTEGPVCEGYARALKVLCDKKGVPCVLVDGYAKGSLSSGGEAHMWNYVQVEDGKWYAVDTTWNDPGSGNNPLSGHENEEWLLVGSTTEISSMAFLDSHPVENKVFGDGELTTGAEIRNVAFTNGPEISEHAFVFQYDCVSGNHKVSLPEFKTLKPATCSSEGRQIRTTHCELCEAVLSEEEATAKLAHTAGATEKQIIRQATCSTSGSSKITQTCKDCSMVMSQRTEVIPALGHSYGGWVTTKAATCTAAGTQKRTCSRSGAHVETRSVAALGHNFGAWRSNGDAQVNVNGTETARCTRCAASKTRTAAGSALAPAKGQTVVVGAASYKATGAATVTYAGPSNKKASSVTVLAAVAVSGRTYKVTAISPKAFAGNKNLKSVKIGANVKTVPASAFKGCTKLTSVSFGNGITSLGKNAFYGCKALKSVTLGTKVTTIGDGAFQNCAKLTKVTVKSTKLSKVGKNAFAGCKRLGTITLKTTKLKSVGKNAFKGTKSKMTVKVPKKKLKAYQKLCKNKGSKTVRVKK